MDRVRLFPGVTVSYSVALWVRYGGQDDGGMHQGSSSKEDMATLLADNFPQDVLSAKFGRESVEDAIGAGSNGESIGDVVDDWLRTGQRASKRADRIKETRHHHGRGNEDGRMPKPQLSALGEEYATAKKDDEHLGTNLILEQILELNDGSARTRFLMELVDGKYDGNYSKCFEGAEIIRAAFHLAQFYGLVENYSGNPQKMAKIFRAMLDSVSKGGVQLTDSLIEHFGLKDIHGLMSRYQPFRKLEALVPKRDVYTIASAMETPGLRQLGGPALMRELGYKAVYHGGTPVLYYMPKHR